MRLNHREAMPQAFDALMGLQRVVDTGGLEPKLLELVRLRASQINGCAFCLHMHTSDALKAGEDAARLFLLDAWRESRLYTPRERAALAWTETLTRVSETHAPDEDYQALSAEFSDKEMADLTLLICQINSWNRIAIGFRREHPNERKAATAA